VKIAITGHTSGIGKAIFEALSTEHDVIGLSRSTGHDITSDLDKAKIIDKIYDCDVFINNAFDYVNFTDAQTKLAKQMFDVWFGENKYIMNVSSRVNDFEGVRNQKYADAKLSLDNFYEETYLHNTPCVINFRPGATDTRVMQNSTNPKMSPEHVAGVVKFIIDNLDNFRIRNITLHK